MSEATLQGLRARPAVPADPADDDALVVCESLVRIHRTGSVEVQALQGLDLRVAAGEMVAVVGASGSGKSTLLQVLAGLDTPTAGRVRVAGHDLAALDRRARVAYRRHVGRILPRSFRPYVPVSAP